MRCLSLKLFSNSVLFCLIGFGLILPNIVWFDFIFRETVRIRRVFKRKHLVFASCRCCCCFFLGSNNYWAFIDDARLTNVGDRVCVVPAGGNERRAARPKRREYDAVSHVTLKTTTLGRRRAERRPLGSCALLLLHLHLLLLLFLLLLRAVPLLLLFPIFVLRGPPSTFAGVGPRPLNADQRILIQVRKITIYRRCAARASPSVVFTAFRRLFVVFFYVRACVCVSVLVLVEFAADGTETFAAAAVSRSLRRVNVA